MDFRNNNSVLVILSCLIYVICASLLNVSFAEEDNNSIAGDDIEVDPYNVREEGCPIVTERYKLNITKLNGNWSMPFASLNWLADIGMALANRSVKMSHITSICPTIILSHNPSSSSTNNNATWTIKWVCPKLNGEFELKCWSESNISMSKFTCWNDKEKRDLYLMVGATDHANWIVLVRCSPGDPARPSEGMSWTILSKQIAMDPDVSDVLFGLLEGYGFDVGEFKTTLLYNNCKN